MQTQTYTVAHLVVPCPVELVPSLTRSQTPDAAVAGGKDFDSLIEPIPSTITPASWENVGGRGSIAPFDAILSLVVSQEERLGV